MNNKKLSIINCQLLIFLIIVFFALPLKAQVNIGSDTLPHSFSILELTASLKKGGLRMPQLDNAERDALQEKFSENTAASEAARGLCIYNIETGCLEFWNGDEWISLCSPTSTVVPQTNPTSTTNNNIHITAYVNAMYDFQYQKLTAYLTSGTATAYQWQMSKDGATWYDISGAKSADFVIPADFMYSLGSLGLDKNNTATGASAGNGSLEIQFRCQITSASATDNTATANILSMLFIRTNTSGYGIDLATGVRYLTINRGVGGDPSGGTVKIALLNLGQSGTGSYINSVPQNIENGKLNDAGDLGDFYQWGRIADGHEHIVWSKNTSVAANDPAYMQNQIIPYGSGSGFTSDTISKDVIQQSYTIAGQIQEGTNGYGKFIHAPASAAVAWGNSDYNLWGNGTNVRSAAPANLSGWTTPANNPCPGDWYVPSLFDMWDIFIGTGVEGIPSLISYPFDSNSVFVNKWTYRAPDTSGNVVGSILITNATGEQVFLPESGTRHFSNSALAFDWGNSYLSSTYDNTVQAYGMVFTFNNALGINYIDRTYGAIVRCVKQ